MVDIPKIRKIQRLGSHHLRLWFAGGATGEWDFSGLARESGPMVAPFVSPAYFDRVFLEDGALTWPNGFDWSPEALHADMAAAGGPGVRGAGSLTTAASRGEQGL